MVEIENKYKIYEKKFGSVNWIGFWTLYKKEVLRFLIVVIQTVISPLVTSLLFLLVLSVAIGNERGEVLGFSFVFIILGSTASFIGKFFLFNSDTFRIIAGSIIIVFSLQLIGIINLKLMNKDARFFTGQYSHNLAFPFLVGAAFGFGWTPCIGPILGSILTLAAVEENIYKSTLLLSFYALGLAIPFIISGILIDKFLFFSKKFQQYMIIVTRVGGTILLFTGIAILTGQLQILGFFILEYFPSLGNIG